MSEPLLRRDRDDRGVVTLTLNRPQAFNALSEAMLTELGEAFARLADDATVRAVVLGASGKAFCAGHDLKEMRAEPSLAYYQGLFAQCTAVMMAIQRLPVALTSTPAFTCVQLIAWPACQLTDVNAVAPVLIAAATRTIAIWSP